MSNKLIYLIMRGIGMFLREFRVNIFSLTTLATLIFVYHMFCTVGVGAASFLTHIAQINTVRVYYNADVKKPEILTAKLGEIEGVRAVKYYSPKDAKEFVVSNAPHISGMKSFAEDFFPAFAELTPVNSSDRGSLDKIEAAASKIAGVEAVSYGKEFMDRFMTISRGSWLFLFVISGLFALAAAFTIYNTVKLSLYRFKEEIMLYSLVGGTRPFISVPYVVMSFLEAIFAYGGATGAFIFCFNIFNSNVLTPAGINIFYLPGLFYFTAAFIVAGIISMVAAMTSVVSFLKKVSSINED